QTIDCEDSEAASCFVRLAGLGNLGMEQGNLTRMFFIPLEWRGLWGCVRPSGFRREHLLDCAAALMRSLQHIRASASVEAEMQQWGGRLYDELIPQELSDALRRDTDASNLIIYLDPACSWIPWELLWDGEVFLCRRF